MYYSDDLDWGIYSIAKIMDRQEFCSNKSLALTNFGDHALHHLFPTLDHGLLPQLYDDLFKTLTQFEADLFLHKTSKIRNSFISLQEAISKRDNDEQGNISANNNNSLFLLRKRISAIDLHLLELIIERRSVASEIGATKLHSDRPVRDKQRERELLDALIGIGKPRGLDSQLITRIFQVIIEDSVLLQEILIAKSKNSMTTAIPKAINHVNQHSACVAFLGPEGSYSHLATREYALSHFGSLVEHSCQTFEDVLDQVESGLADYAVLPVENTSSGSIGDTYDLLHQTNLLIVGEIFEPINHCVLASRNSSLKQIETVYSHVQPFKQCTKFLNRFPHWKIEYCNSTAVAMQTVSNMNSPSVAAIGSEFGGRIYGLQVLEMIQADNENNMTRFLLLAREKNKIVSGVIAKTTISMMIDIKAGTLLEILLIIRNNNLTVTKLESRPSHKHSSEEMFFIDVLAHEDDETMQNVLKQLSQLNDSLRVLGCYPSGN